MRPPPPGQLYVLSGVVWHAAMRAYWLAFVIRITIDLDLPPMQLILLGTALEVTVLVAEIPTGVVADLYSRKWSVVISFVLVGVGIGASAATSNFGALLLTQVLWGFGFTFQSGAETAWVTDELGSVPEAESAVLRRGRLQLVGSVAGLAVGAAVAMAGDVRLTIAVAAVVLIGWAVFLAWAMTEHTFERGRTITWRRMLEGIRSGHQVIRATPVLRILVVVVVIIGVASEAIDRLGVRRLDDLGLSAQTNEVLVLSALAVAEALLGALLLWRFDSRVRGRAAAAGVAVFLAVAALGVGVVAVVAVFPVALVGFVMQSGLRNAADPLIIAWTNARATSRHRATVHSYVGQAGAFGEIGGGLAVGALAATAGVPVALAVSAALFAIAAMGALRAYRAWT